MAALAVRAEDPAQITGVRVGLDTGSRVVGEKCGLKIEVKSPVPLPQGCLIRILVPAAYSGGVFQTLKYVYAYGMFGSIRRLPFKFAQAASSQASVVEVQDACNTRALLNTLAGTLKLKYLENPDSVRTTEPFSIEFYDGKGAKLAETPSSPIYAQSRVIPAAEFRPGSLESAQILPQNKTAGEMNDLIV